MRANGEEREKPQSGNRSVALTRAIGLLSQGRVSAGLRSLGLLAGDIPDDPHQWIEVLVRACTISSLYQREDIGFDLIRKTRVRFRKLRLVARFRDVFREIDLLELRLEFSEKSILGRPSKIEKAFSRIRLWKPWMAAFRSLFLINSSRFEEYDKFLRSPPIRIPRGSVEYATRLEHLGLKFLLQHRLRPSLVLMRAALKEISNGRSLECHYYRAIIRLWIVRIRSLRRSFDRGKDPFTEVEHTLKQFGFRRLSYYLASARLSYLYSTGSYDRAIQFSSEVFLRAKLRSTPEKSHVAFITLNAAQCAIALNRQDQAELLLSRASVLIRRCPLPGLFGYLFMLQGSLSAERGSNSGIRRASLLYKKAEGWFRREGGSYQWWASQLSFHRGALFQKLGKVDEVLREAQRVMEHSRHHSPSDSQTFNLLLKSSLLLNREAPRPELYETVLRQLGVVKDPIFLFKILANLYIYSWDLGDQLDLTDLHLKQLHKLREHLSPAIYERLYHTYVTARVVARFRERFGSEQPAGRKASAL